MQSIADDGQLEWLLAEDAPAVRHRALRELLDRPADAPEVVAARAQAMRAPPIATILAHQEPGGYWIKPGAGYAPKYTGTVWQLMFLDQLGADANDAHVRASCEYVLTHAQATNGGLGASGDKHQEARPAPSRVIHCLNGNLLRALIGFGYLEDDRVQHAIDWQVQSITGTGSVRYYQSGTTGPRFACVANEGLPCAWGATKAMLALARIPYASRTPAVQQAIDVGIEFLLSVDPAVADYPMGLGNTRPSSAWFKPGFPSGYVADVLQVLEVLGELGYGADPRLDHAFEWLLSKRDADGRWRNEYSYHGKLWADIDGQGQPSKWVTLRAYRALKLRQRGVYASQPQS